MIQVTDRLYVWKKVYSILSITFTNLDVIS